MENWVLPTIIAVAVFLALLVVMIFVVRSCKKKKAQGAEEVGATDEGGEEAAETEAVAEEQPEAKQPEQTADEKPVQKKEESAPAKAEPADDDEEEEDAEEVELETDSGDGKEKKTVKSYHISKRKSDGMWQIKLAGGKKAIKLFRTQQEAIDYCKVLAEKQEAKVTVHKKDGSFRKQNY